MSSSASHTVIPLVKTGAKRDGKKAYLKALRKYAISTTHYHFHENKLYIRNQPHSDSSSLEIHPLLHSHPVQRFATAPPPGTAEVSAEDISHDSEYLVTVQVGTPPRPYRLDFDTGSSDLWIAGKGTKEKGAYYDPSGSSTSKSVEGATWKIGYGDGSSAQGAVFTDVVQIGSLTLTEQAVEVSEQLSDEFKGNDTDGLLGLAWGRINTVKPHQVPTPVATMIAQGTRGLFSVALEHDSNDSFYTFGGIDPEKAGVSEADISYVPCISPPHWWQVHCHEFSVNGKTINIHGNTGIVDTGTTLCLVSNDLVQAVYRAISGAKLDNASGLWLIPNKAEIPEIKLKIGTKYYIINPEAFGFEIDEEDYVMGGIQSRGNMSMDIYGDTFLKSIYAVFDQEKCVVGLAQRPSRIVGGKSKPSFLGSLFPRLHSKSRSQVNLLE